MNELNEKLNSKVKRHITLLAERFEHQIRYDKNALILFNSMNTIRIEEYKRDQLEISYNIGNSETKTERISIREVYDLIIKTLTRYEVHEVDFLLGTPIQLKEWMEEEWSKSSRILDLQRKIKDENSEQIYLGGNRYEAEYYKGVIILMDDILWQPCNVIDFPLEK